MTVWESIESFRSCHGRSITVSGVPWSYYRLGSGEPLLWLGGGIRRAALAFSFLQMLARRHTVIAPDYPPVDHIGSYLAAFDQILRAEGVDSFSLGCQSYGGMLAQAYLAHRGAAVRRLVLSSTGPADYGRVWIPVSAFLIALTRLLPDETVKGVLLGGLLRFVTVSEDERAEWEDALRRIMRGELTRADVVSHFNVTTDLIRRGIVKPRAFAAWRGGVVVLRSDNDPTQGRKDLRRYERLFSRPVTVISMGDMGHTALLSDPVRFTEIFERALDGPAP